MGIGALRRCTAILLFGAALLLNGCGYKTRPVPPASVVPQPIADLRYQRDGDGVRLSWSYPVRTIQGEPVEQISAFDLYRAEVAVDELCGGCPIPFGEPIEVDGGSVFDGEVRRTGDYRLSMLREGYKYFFMIRSRASWWAESDRSNLVSFVWLRPAAAPQGLAAIASDRQVALSWQPVTALQDGSPVDHDMKYQVLRRSGDEGFAPLGEPVAAVEFLDRQVQNGVRYFYAIQGMMAVKGELVAGEISRESAATPVDLTPPAPPTGLTAVQTDVGIKIFWDPGDAADLGGYRVYRRAGGAGDFTMIGEVGQDYNLFTDREAAPGRRYYYTVTAFDQAVPPNESAKSKEATFR